MISPTVEGVLDFEGNVEKVFADILTGLGIAAFRSDSDSALPIPRVDVMATLAESGPHERVLTSGDNSGHRIYDQHQVDVQLRYTVAPDTPDEERSDIRQFRGAFRNLIFFPKPIRDAFDSAELYRVAPGSIREQGGVRQVEADEGAVTLQATINLVLFIASDRLLDSFYTGGSGDDSVNKYFYLHGTTNAKSEYRSQTHRAVWSGSQWEIREISGDALVYSSAGDTEKPWDSTPWASNDSEDDPPPTLFQATIRDLLGFAPPPNWS